MNFVGRGLIVNFTVEYYSFIFRKKLASKFLKILFTRGRHFTFGHLLYGLYGVHVPSSLILLLATKYYTRF